MKVRTTVKEYQRRLTQLDADHSRAQDRLDAVRRRRAEVVAEQDRLVAAAEQQVNAAIVTMAEEVGPEVAAALLDIGPADVRRLVRVRRQPAATAGPAAPSSS